MAKIQNTFTQGKMNKDLDERLLPVGQYRHAMNIQVDTSEGSDIGTIQNILGVDTNLPDLADAQNNNGVCLGVVSDEKNNHIYWLSKIQEKNTTKEINVISRYSTDTKQINLVLVDRKNILKFEFDRVITGINIIDDMLFFTDGISEPKKINITRGIQGTTDLQTHTKLVANGNVTSTDLLEEHITVIKKSPKYPPVLEMRDNFRPGIIGGTFEYAFDPNIGVGDTINIELTNNAGTNDPNAFSLVRGDKVVITAFESTAPLFPITNFTIRAVIKTIAVSSPNFPNGWGVGLEIVSFDPDTPLGLDVAGNNRNFALSLSEETEKLFEYKFPRFSYRYKYEDGEYSSFGPFSEVAFLPGNFDYHPKKGYNLGMTNRLNELHLKQFVTEDIPLDVVAIDILYKEVGSNNVYVLDTLKETDPLTINYSGSTSGNFNAWNHPNDVRISASGLSTTSGPYRSTRATGYYKVKSETIFSLLPSNQLLRSYDNVPKYALAQEVTGSRLIYGNYTQNYNLIDDNDKTIKPNIDVTLTSFTNGLLNATQPYKSLKSLREYQVGVVYTDSYGRETPVLTNAEATIQTVKADAVTSNQLSVRMLSNPPEFAKGFKFYVKQTSGEYYNLALDRFYDATDGNIWLAFPSVDRNKVDIESYLILKKGIESDSLVFQKARYKIIDISNEAPDFIKRKRLPLGRIEHKNTTTTGEDVFGDDPAQKFPINGNDNFKIKTASVLNTSSEDIQKILDEPGNQLFVRFEDTLNNKRSKDYRVSSFNRRALTDSGAANPSPLLNIKVDENFGSDVEFLLTDPANPTSSTTRVRTSTTSPTGNIFIVFTQFKVENQAKFDGRFFVKIHNDVDTVTNLSSGVVTSENYRVLSQRTFHFLAANHVDLYKDKDVTQIGPLTQSPYPTKLNSHEINNGNGVDWDVLLDTVTFHALGGAVGSSVITDPAVIQSDYFPDENKLSDYWYTFTAYFRQKGTYDINDRLGHNLNSKTNIEGFEDIWYINGHQYAGVYDKSQSQITNPTAIGEYGITGNKIEIGFGGLEPAAAIVSPRYGYSLDYDEFKEITRFNPGGSYYSTVGTSLQNTLNTGWSNGNGNVYTIGDEATNLKYGNEQDDFASRLQVGTKLRWQNDPNSNIYTVINIEKRFVLRYDANQNNLTSYYNVNEVGSSSTPTSTIVDIINNTTRRPENFQTNWVLTLDKNIEEISVNPSSWHPVLDGDMNGYSVNTDAYVANSTFGASTADHGLKTATTQVLEIVESVDDETLFPENPAIFETEPKDETPLDIYYEASKEYPIKLDDKNISSILNIGSTVRVFNRNPNTLDANNRIVNLFPTEYVLSSIFEGGVLGLNKDLLSNEIYYNQTNNANGYNLLEITDSQNNSITVSIDTWPVPPVAPITVAFNFLVKISKSFHFSQIELPYFNCYSFGNGVESNRIEDNFNKSFIDNGVVASTTVSEVYEEERRKYGLIFSGLYNSTSGINNLNQFIQAENITKDVNPTYGSIQKLFSRQSDLIALCEDKILKILANKDAVFNADGNAQLTANERVLGQTIPFVGEYGISKNPESFATESYRAYFTDKQRGAVLRLSMDGLTPISDAGMKDWFGDNLKLSNYLIGTYDQDKGHYNLTLQNNSLASFSSIPTTVSPLVSSSATTARVAPGNTSGIAPGPVTGFSTGITSGVSPGTTSGVLQPTIIPATQLAGVTPVVTPVVTSVVTPANQRVESYTLSYSEQVKGWTSFKSFIPENGVSCSNKYYTFYNANIFEHHIERSDRNTFYFGEYTPSSVTFIFNQEPSVVKEFRALTYEGSQARILSNYNETSYLSGGTQGVLITTRTYSSYKNINNENGWYTKNIKTDMEEGNIPYFVNKERKWFNYIRGNNIDYSTAAISGPSFELDSSKFSIQGIGRPSDVKKIVTIVTPPPVVPCNITWHNTDYQFEWLVEIGNDVNSPSQLGFEIHMFGATSGTLDAAGNQSFRYEVTYQILGLMVNEAVLTSLTDNLNNNVNMTSGSLNTVYINSGFHDITNDSSIIGAAPGDYDVLVNVKAYDLTHPDSASCVTTASFTKKEAFTINAVTQAAPCNISWLHDPESLTNPWNVQVNYNNSTGNLETDIIMYTATNGTLDSNGNQNFEYEVSYQLLHPIMPNPAVITDATDDLNNYLGMVDGTWTSSYGIESMHNMSGDNFRAGFNWPTPGTYDILITITAKDLNHPGANQGCIVSALFGALNITATSPQVVPCNIAWSNTNFQADWNTDINYNSSLNQLDFDIDMYTAVNGTLDSNGNQNFNYTIRYQLLDSSNDVLTPNSPVLPIATNSVNSNLNMTRGISGNSNFAPADFVAGDQRDITQDVVSGITLPLSPGTYSVNIFIIAEDLNHPGPCTINTTLTKTFTVAAPIVNQLLPGTLTLTQTNNGNPNAAVNARFTSASGGTAPYTYTNIQWRETDANGNVLSGMSGTFTPINSSSSPNINNQFNYTWPFGNQTTAYVTVTYDITDSSVPQQTLTHEGTIAVTRPAPPPPPPGN